MVSNIIMKYLNLWRIIFHNNIIIHKTYLLRLSSAALNHIYICNSVYLPFQSNTYYPWKHIWNGAYNGTCSIWHKDFVNSLWKMAGICCGVEKLKDTTRIEKSDLSCDNETTTKIAKLTVGKNTSDAAIGVATSIVWMGHADCCSNLLKTTRVCCSALLWKTRNCIKICWYLQWQCNNHRGIPVYSWKKIICICIGVDTSDIWGAVDLNLHIDSSRTVFRVMPAEKKCRLIRQWLINYTIKDTGGNRRLMRNLHNRGCLSGLRHRMNYGYVILKTQEHNRWREIIGRSNSNYIP